MTSILREAQTRILGHVDVEGERSRIQTLLRDLGAAGWDAEVRAAEAAFERLLETSHDLSEIRAAFDARESSQAGGRAHNEIRDRLQLLQQSRVRQSREITPEAVEPALMYLHDRLGQVMAHVRELDRALGDTRTIEQAIHSEDDVLRAWRDAEDAADEYAQIRAAQTLVFRMVPESYRPSLAELYTLGHLTNAFDLESFWVGTRKSLRHVPGRDDATYIDWLHGPSAPKWLRAENEIWPGDERIPFLRWLATTGRPWVPTIAQLADVSLDVKAMIGSLSTLNQFRAALDAHDRYYKARGVTPARPLNITSIRALLPGPNGIRGNRDADGTPRSDPRIRAIAGE